MKGFDDVCKAQEKNSDLSFLYINIYIICIRTYVYISYNTDRFSRKINSWRHRDRSHGEQENSIIGYHEMHNADPSQLQHVQRSNQRPGLDGNS